MTTISTSRTVDGARHLSRVSCPVGDCRAGRKFAETEQTLANPTTARELRLEYLRLRHEAGKHHQLGEEGE